MMRLSEKRQKDAGIEEVCLLGAKNLWAKTSFKNSPKDRTRQTEDQELDKQILTALEMQFLKMKLLYTLVIVYVHKICKYVL